MARARSEPRPTGLRASKWFKLAVIAAAAGLAVVLTDVIDPLARIRPNGGPILAFAAVYGVFLALFGTAYALLYTGIDLLTAWERATPESERERRSDSGGWLDLGGGGDSCGSGDGGCGGD